MIPPGQHSSKFCAEKDKGTGRPGARLVFTVDPGSGQRRLRSQSVNQQVKHFDTDEHCDRRLHGDVPGFLALSSIVLLGQPGKQWIADALRIDAVSLVLENAVVRCEQGLHRPHAMPLESLPQGGIDVCDSNTYPAQIVGAF